MNTAHRQIASPAAAFRLLLLIAVACAAVQAQSSNGYVFFAPGGVTSGGNTNMTLSVGGGGEGILGKGVGIGVELGALWPRQNISEVIGAFSPNGYYHFPRAANRKVDPFVTGGYTLLFRQGHANAFNFGGGMNYWFGEKLGLRAEFRDHVYDVAHSPVHYWGVRIGLAFR